MSALIHLRDGRLAVHDRGVLLAVPPMHPATSRETRAKVLELVLRRLFGEALDLARDTADDLDRVSAQRQMLGNLMAQTPHRNARNHGLAA